jgi:hypothetical protein
LTPCGKEKPSHRERTSRHHACLTRGIGAQGTVAQSARRRRAQPRASTRAGEGTGGGATISRHGRHGRTLVLARGEAREEGEGERKAQLERGHGVAGQVRRRRATRRSHQGHGRPPHHRPLDVLREKRGRMTGLGRSSHGTAAGPRACRRVAPAAPPPRSDREKGEERVI